MLNGKVSQIILTVLSLAVVSVLGSFYGLYLAQQYLGYATVPKVFTASLSTAGVTHRAGSSAATSTHKAYVAQAPDYAIPPTVDGLAPLLINIPTKQHVVFLGIDDGANKQDFELQLLKKNNVKASLFLANLFIKDNPSFFKDYVRAGYPIEDHTVNHRLLSKLSYEEQKKEICDEADLQLQQFGRRPILFRPPGGDYNTDTRRAAAACGMKAVILWIAKANGGSMQYQVGNSLRPGDIVLMHFRPEFAQDLQAFLDAQHAAGLHTALLEDWLL